MFCKNPVISVATSLRQTTYNRTIWFAKFFKVISANFDPKRRVAEAYSKPCQTSKMSDRVLKAALYWAKKSHHKRGSLVLQPGSVCCEP